MEAPDETRSSFGVDVHGAFCEIAVVNGTGQVAGRDRTDTTITALVAILEKVRGPRSLVTEEGPLAGWLWQSLQPWLDDMRVSEPRRNRLIAEDRDKDDVDDGEAGPVAARWFQSSACLHSRD